MYVGCLPVELDPDEQDVRDASLLLAKLMSHCLLPGPCTCRVLICSASMSCMHACSTQTSTARCQVGWWNVFPDVAVQEAALELYTQFNCCVVFLGADLKERYYKGTQCMPEALLLQRHERGCIGVAVPIQLSSAIAVLDEGHCLNAAECNSTRDMRGRGLQCACHGCTGSCLQPTYQHVHDRH